MIGKPLLIEAFCGEYASGKSENSIGRSMVLLENGDKVRLVDLDLAEPFYTLRPLRDVLKRRGLDVVAADPKASIGLGEAGTPISGEVVGSLHFDGKVVLDLGHGPRSVRVLNLLDWDGIDRSSLRIYLVLNSKRPMTSTVRGMVECIDAFRRQTELYGLISNSNLGEETVPETVLEGAGLVDEAGRVSGVPLIVVSVNDKLSGAFTDDSILDRPIWRIGSLMSGAYW